MQKKFLIDNCKSRFKYKNGNLILKAGISKTGISKTAFLNPSYPRPHS
jgi:hypothetical protein